MKNYLFLLEYVLLGLSPVILDAQADIVNLYGGIGPERLVKSEYHEHHYYLIGRKGEGDSMRAVLTKVNLSGGVEWQVDLGQATTIFDIEFGSGGVILLSGTTNGPTSTKKSILGKLTDQGSGVTVDWLRYYDLNSRDAMSSFQLRSVGNDEYLLQGYYVANGLGDDDVLLYTLDAMGEITSVTTYDGGDDQYWLGNIPDKDSSFTLVGNMGGTGNGCYVTINSNLSVKEAYKYNEVSTINDASIDVVSGIKTVVGVTNGQTAFVAHLDVGGDMRWGVEYPDIDVFRHIAGPVREGFELNYYILGTGDVGGIQRPLLLNVVADTTYGPAYTRWVKYLDDGESEYDFGHILKFDAGAGEKLLYSDSRVNVNGHGDFDALVTARDLNFDGCITDTLSFTRQGLTLTKVPLSISKGTIPIPAFTNEAASITTTSSIALCEPTVCSPNVLCELPGDTYISKECYGIILKSPNGACFRMSVDNAGQVISQAVVCPQ